MKHYIFFTAIIFLVSMMCIFFIEKKDVLSLKQIDIATSIREEHGESILTWERIPYPCYYRVDTYIKMTGKISNETVYQRVKSEFTTTPSYHITSAPIPFYYRITAYGMFGAVTSPSTPKSNPYFEAVFPIHISKYPESSPASLMPFLIWHSMANAVLYEVEFLSAPPEKDGGIALSKTKHLSSTQGVFTNGMQADLRKFQSYGTIYWRVRALGLKHEPIGEFSPAEPIVLSGEEELPNRPIPNTFDQVMNFRQPLYPVYQWIPLNGVTRYEVELLSTRPVNDHGTEPDPSQVWSAETVSANAVYDEYPRPYAGIYYWRVRGLDAQGKTVGTWSDIASFTVEAPHNHRLYAAALGDSITHGGGAISNSPALLEYSYTTYLPFECLNLGRSGDTAHTTLERFEQDVLPAHPENLLILTGSNSLRADTTSAQDIIRDLDAIQRKCIAYDIRPVFLTLLPLNPERITLSFQSETDPLWHLKLNAVNTWIRAQRYHIDMEPFFYDASNGILSPLLSTDGLHPDIDGKRMMAEVILQHLDDLTPQE